MKPKIVRRILADGRGAGWVLMSLLSASACAQPARVMLMNRLGPSSIELMIASADGTGERQLLPGSAFDYNASFSPDGRWIIFTSEREGYGQADLYRVHPDGSGLERLTDDPAVDDQGALSPDGQSVAFVSTRAAHTANVWVLSLDSGNARNLTGDFRLPGSPGSPNGYFRPSWSPDGRWLAFSSDRGTAWRGHEHGAGAGHTQQLSLYVVRADGTELKRITDSGTSTGSPKWSADGRRLIFYEIDPTQTFLARMPPLFNVTSQIVSVDITTGERVTHTSGPGLKVQPQFLPSGGVGYLLKAAPPSSSLEPGLISSNGPNLSGVLRNPAWSPDGRYVVYEKPDFSERPHYQRLYSWQPGVEYRFTDVFPSFSSRGRLVVTELNATLGNPQTAITAMDADGSNARNVFSDPSGAAMMGSWSPDGRQLVFGFGGFFAGRSQHSAKVMLVNADGSQPTSLTTGLPNAGFPSFSPDGRTVAYRVWGADGNGGEARGLRLMNLADRTVTVLTTEWDNFPMWSPDGTRVLFTRQDAQSRDFDVFVIGADGNGLQQLTTSAGTDGHATWTADGSEIFFMSSRTGFKDEATLYDFSPQPYAQIFLMAADGSNARQLTDSRWEDSMPVFVPQ